MQNSFREGVQRLCSLKRIYYHGVKLPYSCFRQRLHKRVLITPGSVHDVWGLYELPLNLGSNIVLYADRGYTDYEAEDLLKEFEGISLMPIRRKNSKKSNALQQFVAKVERRFIETVGSCLKALFPKRIHAVTLEGFVMKLKLFILSFNIQQLLKVAS